MNTDCALCPPGQRSGNTPKTEAAGEAISGCKFGFNWLLANPELGDKRLISLRGTSLQIIQQLTPLSDEQQKTTTGTVIFFVSLEVVGELRDTSA